MTKSTNRKHLRDLKPTYFTKVLLIYSVKMEVTVNSVFLF